MTKSFTATEMSEDLKTLDFKDMEDLVVFVRAYVEDYKAASDEDMVDKTQRYVKYCLVMAEFGPSLLRFTENMLKEKEALEKIRDDLVKLKAQAA